jgi:hypothetical protein
MLLHITRPCHGGTHKRARRAGPECAGDLPHEGVRKRRGDEEEHIPVRHVRLQHVLVPEVHLGGSRQLKLKLKSKHLRVGQLIHFGVG